MHVRSAPVQKFIFAFCVAFGCQWALGHATQIKNADNELMRRKQEQGNTDSASLQVDPKDVNEDFEASPSGDPHDDLPIAYDVEDMKNFEISAQDIEAGKELLEGKYGKLYALYMESMVNFITYWARAIQRVGQTAGPNGTNLTAETPSKDEMKKIFHEWRTELLKFEKCPEEPLDMEACMGVTRCLVESEVGKSINASFFATFVEIQTEVATTQIKDFELHFKEAKKTAVPLCSGEGPENPAEPTEVAEFIDQFEASSERQWRAVSAVATVQHAADLTERASAMRSNAVSTDFQDIWHPPCATLGCDHSSFRDIAQTMHGHVAELVEVNAPAPVIRMYVRAMRTAIHATKAWIGQGDFRRDHLLILDKPGQHSAANELYNQQFKSVGGVLSGAYSLLKARRNGWWGKVWKAVVGCMQIFVSTVLAYAKKFPSPANNWGAVVGITASYGVGSNSLKNILYGHGVCTGVGAKIAFGVVIGFVPGVPEAACFRVGVSIEASFSFNSCTGSLNLSLTAGGSGSILWAGTTCPFGTWLGPFKCANGLALGIGVICCTFNLLNGGSNCR